MYIEKYIPPEIIAQILEDNKSLSGSMTRRALQLKKKYPYSEFKLRNLVRNTVCQFKRHLTDEQREQVKVLYSLESGDVAYVKYMSVAEKTGIRCSTVKSIIKAQEIDSTEYFNPRMQMF